MTPNQRKFLYFPAWHKCAKVNGWVMSQGRLGVDLAAQALERIPSPAFDERFKVIERAEFFARQAHRAPVADDLRHACNYVASAGRATSSEALSGRPLTLAVRLFRLLADPDNIQAVMDWLNPDEADRKDYCEWVARNVPEPTLRAIAQNAWGEADWRSQPMPRLRWLHKQAAHKPASKNAKAAHPF